MMRFSIICGLIGPLLFALVVSVLTLLKYDFLRGLGWHPLFAPTFDWPSGLALGQHGWIMTTTFVLTGLLQCVFALGLGAALARTSEVGPTSEVPQIGTALLALAGLAQMGLAFTTDPTLRTTPATWHGRLHDASFVLLGLTLLPAIICLGLAFRGHPDWRRLAIPTWIAAASIIPAFVLKGAAFYLFLGAVLCWSEVIAGHLARTPVPTASLVADSRMSDKD